MSKETNVTEKKNRTNIIQRFHNDRPNLFWLVIALLIVGLIAALLWLGDRIRPSQNTVASAPTNNVPAAATEATPTNAPTPAATECDGCNWTINDATKTITWTGCTEGNKDIHQGTNSSIAAVRAGYKVTFVTKVPGEIIITVGNIDGVAYSSETRVPVPAGTHVVTDSIGNSGGFRWTPADGYGWRQ